MVWTVIGVSDDLFCFYDFFNGIQSCMNKIVCTVSPVVRPGLSICTSVTCASQIIKQGVKSLMGMIICVSFLCKTCCNCCDA